MAYPRGFRLRKPSRCAGCAGLAHFVLPPVLPLEKPQRSEPAHLQKHVCTIPNPLIQAGSVLLDHVRSPQTGRKFYPAPRKVWSCAVVPTWSG